MPRYPHFITRKSEGRWPGIVLCIDCSVSLISDPLNPGRETEQFESWSAIECKPGEAGWYEGIMVVGNSVSGFWRTILRYTERCHNIWIISYQCGRIWSLLDFWGQLESGYVRIGHTRKSNAERIRRDVRRMREDSPNPIAPSHAGSVSRLLDQSIGSLVCEDPPSIANFRLGVKGAKATWVDCRNYGVESVGRQPPGSERAEALVTWWIDYCGLLVSAKLGSPRTTAGAQAINGWRYGYYTGGAYVHTDESALTVEGASYHGGRCECRRIGTLRSACYHIDVRSMYPAVCAAYDLPHRLCGYSARCSNKEYRDIVQRHAVIAEVYIRSAEPAYPVSRNNITIWPIGTYRTTLCGPELADAFERGRIVEWGAYCWYDQSPVLQDYAYGIYHARCEGEQKGKLALQECVKKLLVVLPGKFGQRSRWWVSAPDITPAKYWGEWWGVDARGEPCRYRSLGGQVQQDRDMGWGGESVPAIAAYITSYGRMVLLSAIRIAGWDEVYYMDTDSLILTEVGYGRLRTAGKVAEGSLGCWQTKDLIKNGRIDGIKFYTTNGRIVCSGLPRGTCVDNGDDKHYWYTISPTWSIGRNNRPDATRILKEYSRGGAYQHGVVCEDGRVKPIELREE